MIQIEVDLGNGRKFAFTSDTPGITPEIVQHFYDNQPEEEKAALWEKIQKGTAKEDSVGLSFSGQFSVLPTRFPLSHDSCFGRYHDEVTRAISNLNQNELVILADLIGDTLQSGKQVVLCGVAGAGYVASHFVSDAQMGLVLPLCRVSSLSDNTGLTAAWANDVGLDSIFSGQVVRIMDKGDLFIGLTTSGNSESVIKAMQEARLKGCNVTCITGKGTSKLSEALMTNSEAFSTRQHIIGIDSNLTPAIQDVYQFIFHAIYLYLKEKLKPMC
jgi:D-sedoheptulose 7-phosphate isomerase